MKKYTLLINCLLLFGLFLFFNGIKAQNTEKIISPEKHFGFYPGSDYNLFDYEQLISYFQELEKNSSRIKLIGIGESSEGRPMYAIMISSSENITNLNQLKEINRKLALDPNLSEDEVNSLIRNGKVFMLATLSMHSTEVGPSQASPLIAYDLITTTDPQKLKWMDDVVYMMVPNHNPDGMNKVVNHYKKYKGTKYEGSSLPGVYHKYVGHNINRDFVTLSQKENKAVAGIYNLNWFPQVMIEKHQMGNTGIRYFVPPMHDPIAVNIDAGIWNWTKLFGSNMIKDMTKVGQQGIAQNYLFDDYWPGSTETSAWKNVISMLTEAASVKNATPVFIEENELSVSGKGLSEYKKSINMPDPWPGGWWRLGDIVAYEITSTMSILKTSSIHHDDILKFRNDLCKSEVKKGMTEAPFYYILPLNQNDQSELVKLVHLMNEHGIDVYELKENLTIENRNYSKGDVVIPLAHPFRSFIKEVMEIQEYPVRHYTPGGEVMKPYDITSWSLPLHRGLQCDEINTFFEIQAHKLSKIDFEYNLNSDIPKTYASVLLSVYNNESYKMVFKALTEGLNIERLNGNLEYEGKIYPEGSFVIYADKKKKWLESELSKLLVKPAYLNQNISYKGTRLENRRIALVETYIHDMDAGWTRFIFDNYGIPYTIVHPGDFEKTDFTSDFDIVIFPDNSKSVLMSGKNTFNGKSYIMDYSPEYTKGIEKKGMNQLMKFVDAGGVIISWERSIDLFEGVLTITDDKEKTEEFMLPFTNISPQLRKNGLFCPGSLLKITLKMDHPLTLGMPTELGIFSKASSVFETKPAIFDMERRVIAKFSEKNILMSGYIEKEELLSNKSAMIWLKKGKGQLVLFNFNPQFRGSTAGTFKLLFNSLLLPKL